MLRLATLAPMAAGALLCGCNPTISFDTSVKGTSQIPGSSVPGVLQLPANLGGLNNINFQQQANLSNNNTDKDHIDHVRVKSLTLTVTTPSPGDLSFLKTLSLSVASAGLPTKRIAHLEVFPAGQASIAMTLDGVDLAPYAKAASFSINADGSGTAPSQNTSIDATMVMTIDAHVL